MPFFFFVFLLFSNCISNTQMLNFLFVEFRECSVCLLSVCTELMRVFVFVFVFVLPYKILYWNRRKVPLGFAKYNNSLSALALSLNLIHRCFHSNNTYVSPPNGISTAASQVCVWMWVFLLHKCIIFILKVQDSLNASIKKIGCEPK